MRDGQRITVALVGQHELTFVIGAPQIVGPLRMWQITTLEEEASCTTEVNAASTATVTHCSIQEPGRFPAHLPQDKSRTLATSGVQCPPGRLKLRPTSRNYDVEPR